MDPSKKWVYLSLAASVIGGALFLSSRKSSKLEAKDSKCVQKIPAEKKQMTLEDFGLEKVGDGTEMAADYPVALETFAKRCEDTGKGAGFIDVYGMKTLIVTDPEITRKVLAHSVQHSLWGGLTAASEAFFGKNVLFVLEGRQWRFLRTTLKHSLLKQSVSLMTKDIVETAEEFSSKLESEKEVDLSVLFGLFHLSAIGKSAFNFDLDCLADENLGPNEIAKNFEWFIDELPRRSLDPDQTVSGDYKSDNEANKKWNDAANALRNTIRRVVDGRLEESGIIFEDSEHVSLKIGKDRKETRKDLLNAMIFSAIEAVRCVNERTGEVEFDRIDKNVQKVTVSKTEIEKIVSDITDNLVEILFAGYNTNVGTMANMIHFLAMNPNVQKKCLKEVDEFFDEGKEFDVKHLPFLSNVFYETLRLRPPAPLIARKLDKDFDFITKTGENIKLPADYPLWVPVEYLQVQNSNWFEYDAKLFKPERWSLKKPCKAGSYLPFSYGPRDCIGKNFALLEAVAGIAHLLKRFEFKESKDYVYKRNFNGFGYRPFDATTGKSCMRVFPLKR